MPMCNFDKDCGIFTPKLDDSIKERYCNGEFSLCARWKMLKSEVQPPTQLQPDDYQRADILLAHPKFCPVCGTHDVEEGYHYTFCHDCRVKNCKMPYPLWIKLSFVAVLAVFIFAMISLPASLEGAVAMERGNRAYYKMNYSAATKHYQDATKHSANNMELTSSLFMAYVNNGDYEKADEIYKQMAGKKVDDSLFNKVDPVVKKFEKYYWYSDGLQKVAKDNSGADAIKIRMALEDYVKGNPTDVVATYLLADKLYDENRFKDVDRYLEGILRNNNDYTDGWLLLAASKREQQKYDEAIQCCNRVLDYSNDCASAYSSQGKIEVKRGNGKKGIELMQKAVEYAPDDIGVLYNLVLAYHFNNMPVERDKVLADIKTKNPPKGYEEQINAVMNGDLKW